MIKFGTGGWRAIIGDEFTKANVQKLAQALSMEEHDNGVVIGFDRRFLSDVAAMWLAEVLAGNNIKVHFIEKAVPTPITMFGVKELNTNYGVAITASHNPALYNGVKVFTKGGKDAGERTTDQLEINLRKLGTIRTIPFEEGLKSGIISYYKPNNNYIDSIIDSMDIKAIRDANLRVLVDPMHGVSKTSLSTILNSARVDVEIINDRHDTLFGGKLPSPASATLGKLQEMVKSESFHMGIATDGDADRIGIVDEFGNFIHPNLLLCLLYYYLLEYKQWTGAVVRNLSTTHMLDKIAKDHGEEAIETPVGFKHITEGMEKYNALIGGESSGGLTIRGHISGKDGIFAATLLVEMIAVTKKTIHQLVKEIYEKYGSYYNQERDYRFSDENKELVHTLLMEQKQVPIFDQEIDRVSYIDGVKVYFKDDSWVCARFSGTEPLIRIFSESSTLQSSIDSITAFESFLGIESI